MWYDMIFVSSYHNVQFLLCSEAREAGVAPVKVVVVKLAP